MTSPVTRKSNTRHGLLTLGRHGTYYLCGANRGQWLTIFAPRYRYALNIKGLKYKTEWVEYPDIEALCKKIGAPHTEQKTDGHLHYTLPVIYDPSTKRVVEDSGKIVKYLDEQYPDTPQLFPAGTDALQALFHEFVWTSVGFQVYMLVVAQSCAVLNPPSAEYFRRTREVSFGKPLAEVGTEQQWTELEAGLAKLDGYLAANGKGKDLLVLGDKISYSDVQVAAILVWARIVCGKESEVWKRLIKLHGGKWATFLEQFAKYESVV